MRANVLRIGVIVAWVAGLVALEWPFFAITQPTATAAVTVAAGLLVGRWQLLVVPTIPIVGLIVVVLFAYDESDAAFLWSILLFYWLALAVLLGLGIGLHKAIVHALRHGPVGTAGRRPASQT